MAVLADVHFHDPAGDFGGAGILLDGTRLALRSWQDTRTAARAINESAAALRAALQKVAQAGVRHVILAGDYSDDGQAENLRALAALLTAAESRLGLRFYAIPGNHDLFGAHGKNVTTRLVTAPGQSVMVTSDPDLAAQEPGAILTAAMRCPGLPEGLNPMARFGFFRRPDDLHWESPFGPQDQPQARYYAATSADGAVTRRLMDCSYLVEPEPGLWLLMMDANVFEPQSGPHDPTRKRAFLPPSNAGWNAVMRVKPFLLPWIADVTARARRLGKTLIPVSHYPVLDPFEDDGSEEALFGQTSNVRRKPLAQVGQALIAAGLRWHLGGHMHVNATTRMTTATGSLTDLALPALVAFPAAFKILHANPQSVRVQTVTLDDLAPDPRLTQLYQAEGHTGPALAFGAFLAAQRRRYLVARRLPQDWPRDLLARLADKDLRFLDPEAPETLPLTELICDAYLVKVAGPLAKGWVAADRLALYRRLTTGLLAPSADPDRAFLQRFLGVFRQSLARMDRDDSQITLVAADGSPEPPRKSPSGG